MRSRLSHLARRADSHPLALGLATLAVILLLTFVGFQSLNGVPFQKRYHLTAILPPASPPLKPGDMVRVAGQRAGAVRHVGVAPDGLRVDLELTPQNAPVGRDARAEVRQRSTGGVFYVDITRGDYRARALPDGATLPRSQTRTGGELLRVVSQFDPGFRTGIRRNAQVWGGGFAGQGPALNGAVRDLPSLLRKGTPELEALAPAPGALTAAMTQVRRTAAGLAGDGALGGLVNAGGATLRAFGRSAPAIRDSIDRFPPFARQATASLPVVDDVLRPATDAVRELRPGIRALDAAVPDVNRLLARGGTLDTQIARLTQAADPALSAAQRALIRLLDVASMVRPFLEPVGRIAAQLAPYDREGFVLADSLIRATNVLPPNNVDLGPNKGNHVQRINFVFTCMAARNPYPAPGEAAKDVKAC